MQCEYLYTLVTYPCETASSSNGTYAILWFAQMILISILSLSFLRANKITRHKMKASPVMFQLLISRYGSKDERKIRIASADQTIYTQPAWRDYVY